MNTISQANLHWAVSIASRMCNHRSSVPACTMIKFDAHADGLVHFSGTNLDAFVKVRVPARVTDPAEILLPAKTLNDLLATYPTDSVSWEIETRPAKARLACGRHRSSLNGVITSGYPTFTTYPVRDDELVDAQLLTDAINAVCYAAAKDDTRPALAGVLFAIGPQGATLTAADGFRLATTTVDGGKIEAGSATLDFAYPDFKEIIKNAQPTTAPMIFGRAALLTALAQADAMKESSSAGVVFVFENNLAKINGRGSEFGEFHAEIEFNGPPPGHRLGVGIANMIAALKSFRGELVEISTNADTAPVFLRSDNTIALVMPMTLD